MTEANLTITVKYGKGYEESWVVFRGSPDSLQLDICGYFGISTEWANGATLNELVIAATHLAHGTGSMAAVLGATPISTTEKPATETGPSGSAAWGQFDKKASESAAVQVDPNSALIVALTEAVTIEDLKRLWADNQAAFSDKAVAKAYGTRGKALKAAA